MADGSSPGHAIAAPHVATERATARGGAIAHAWRTLSSVMVAGAATGVAGVVADTLARESWAGFDRDAHFRAALWLYGAIGTGLGVAACAALWLLTTLPWLVRGTAPPSYVRARWRGLRLPAAAGAAAMVVCADTAFWAFTGEGVQGSGIARWGPYLALAIVFSGSATYAALVRAGIEGALGRPKTSLAIGLGLLFAATALAAVDLTFLVALYRRLHELLEIVAAIGALGGFTVIVYVLRARCALHRAFTALGLAAALSLLWFLTSSTARVGLDEKLSHVWAEPVYIGRMLYRLQLADAYLSDPSAWRSAQASRMDRLKQRYDITTVTLGPAWTGPTREPAAVTAKLRALHAEKSDFNVVVFYIDTLRHDVGSDAGVMPELVGLAKRSVDFRRAYSFASDTVTALPVLIGGNYLARERERDSSEHDVFARAERAKIPSALFIGTSARRFLNNQLPRFHFDHTAEVSDYSPRKDVWGYGADRSSAMSVTDEALSWIDQRTSERFFAWLFNFDVHNWKELDDDHIETAARRHAIEDPEPDLRRYKAAAAAVDEALGRFLHGLEQRGLADRTIVMVIADHGEALGRHGHWQHAVFLWDVLVRTPLVVHVPGIEPRVVEVPVGHADVAPTLARCFDPNADVSHYQGYDLFAHAIPGQAVDDLPILLMSMRKEDVLRIGLIDRHAPFHKLVLPLDSAEPELHDLSAYEPDDLDLARQHRGIMLDLLSKLVRSPVFPRDEPVDPADAKTDKTARN